MRITILPRLTLAAALGIAAAFAPLVPMTAQAAAPMVKQSAPGYYRMMLGDFEITALSDGTVALPMDKMLINTTPAHVDQVFNRSYLKSPVETSVNAFLVNTGSKLVLIDTGAGNLFGPTLGKLLANLKAAGYQPEQVDDILITHMHPDHVGGLATVGERAFPNATVHADKREAAFWLDQKNMDKAPADAKDSFKGAMGSLQPYEKAGKFKTFENSAEVVPGIKALVAPGHTPGHTTYMIESKGEKMLAAGDLIHVASVQFPEPGIAIKFDSDPKKAVAEREQIFADAARHGYWLAAAHLPFPGIGHVRQEGKGFVWFPVNYTVLH